MTDMEVIAIANEVYGKGTPWHGVQRQRLMMLAERLLHREREACARVVEPLDESLADAIRARGTYEQQ